MAILNNFFSLSFLTFSTPLIDMLPSNMLLTSWLKVVQLGKSTLAGSVQVIEFVVQVQDLILLWLHGCILLWSQREDHIPLPYTSTERAVLLKVDHILFWSYWCNRTLTLHISMLLSCAFISRILSKFGIETQWVAALNQCEKLGCYAQIITIWGESWY